MSAEDRPPSRGRGVETTTESPHISTSRDAETLIGSTSRNTSLDRAMGSPPQNTSLDRVSAPINESSPLLSAAGSGNDEEEGLVDDRTVLDDDYDEYQETRSVWYLILLTCSIGGLQIAWSVELSNGSPYLLSLGLSKSLMALVWIAGPLSGSLVQPYVGIKSDNCRLSWGKRKPFMISGALATIVSLMALAWTKEIVGGIFGLFGADIESSFVKNCIIVVAVFFVYVLDFSINTVQAAIRAFMVDCSPTHQQESTNAWAGRITGIGNILGYLSGYINLPRIMWFFGNTQFKVLCVIACIALGTTVTISCIFIKERDPRREGPPRKDKGGVISFFKQVFGSIKRLPPQTRKVCEVQFFAWIGWFPFLFYVTTWVGELYVQPYFEANPHLPQEEIDHLYEKATRVGTFALLIWAITSFISNLLLPLFVAPTYEAPLQSSASIRSQKSYTTRTTRFFEALVIPWLTLRRAWMLSHVLFAICMWLTLFVRTPTGATAVVSFVGLSWALTLWAPFALISQEISKRDALRRSRQSTREVIDGAEDNLDDQAGVILGLHNVAIAAPQIIATLGSSLIFRMLQKPRGTPGDDSVGWVLRAGGIAALVAAWATSRVGEERDNPENAQIGAPRGGRKPLPRTSSFSGLLEYEPVGR